MVHTIYMYGHDFDITCIKVITFDEYVKALGSLMTSREVRPDRYTWRDLLHKTEYGLDPYGYPYEQSVLNELYCLDGIAQIDLDNAPPDSIQEFFQAYVDFTTKYSADGYILVIG
jgi:hypothetical protein